MNFEKSTLVALKLSPGKEKHTFGKQALLAGKKIKSIIAMPGGNGEKTPAGDPIDGTITSLGYLELNDANNTTLHDNIPCALLNPIKGVNGRIIELDIENVDWEKSSLRLSGIAAEAYAAFFIVYE